jgi:hypothetical protein
MSLWRSLFSISGETKSQDRLETKILYERVRQRHVGSRYEDEVQLKEYRGTLFFSFEEKIPAGLRGAFYGPYLWLLMSEEIIFDMPELREGMTLEQEVELRGALRRKETFQLNERKVIQTLEEGIERIFTYVGEQLPDVEGSSPFTIPLMFALPNPKETMRNLIGELWQQQYRDAVLFVPVTRQLHLNLCAASGIPNPHDVKKAFVLPTESKAPLPEIVDTYFADTPFQELFNIPVPLKLGQEEFFNHCQILGGSGAGKTQLLQNLILHHLESDAALVIVDSQGDLIDKVSHLAGIEDRLVLLTPKDIEHPPAINIFDIDKGRLGTYDALTREQVTAGVIDTFDYLFTGLIGADLTAKQGVLFRYIARLMLAMPQTMGRNATIMDMIRLMDDAGPYMPAIDALTEIPRTFFLHDFKERTFDQTKEQIRFRLQAIIENPTLARLFTSPQTKVDFFTELNSGSIICIDTAKDFLKSGSSHFGRIFISLILQAVMERAAIPENQRRPAFLLCDESHEYFDENIDDLLTEARKYKFGCCFAHQHLEQCTPGLRASFAANTGIKFAGGVSTSDARSLAPDMHTTAEFITGQPRLHFACHIRNVTPQAVSIPIEVGKLERRDRLTDDEYRAVREMNRLRVSLPAQPAPPPPQAPAAVPPEPTPATVGVSFLITRSQRQMLQQRGYTDEQIRGMTPEVAHRILDASPNPAPQPTISEATRKDRKRPKKRHGPLTGHIDTSA